MIKLKEKCYKTKYTHREILGKRYLKKGLKCSSILKLVLL